MNKVTALGMIKSQS